MNKIALASLVLGAVAAAPSAFAQCPPGSWLCADITIGTTPPPPPPTIYVQPAPPPVVVYQPPPPPTVYVQPAPPPMVVYSQPAPEPMYVQQVPYPARRRNVFVGLQAHLGGIFSGSATGSLAGLGGAGAGLRLRGNGHWGAEASLDVMGGRDFNGDGRAEVPISLAALFYFNPQNRFQVYALAGVGMSFAGVAYAPENIAAHGGLSGASYTYLGGLAGLGAELQLSRRFSLFADVRGFLRTRVDPGREENPEFSRTLSSGATQTTNGSMGVLGQLGAILYF